MGASLTSSGQLFILCHDGHMIPCFQEKSERNRQNQNKKADHEPQPGIRAPSDLRQTALVM